MYTQKFDYYSADHTWGGQHALLMYYVQWEKRERPALLVEQRECFRLPFIAPPCDLPSWRYNLLEITLSFQNAQSVPLLVSRPLYKGGILVSHGWITGLRAMSHGHGGSI